MFIKSTCCTNISCSTKNFLAPMWFYFICSTKVHRLFLLHKCSPILIVPVFTHFLHWCPPKVSVTLMFINDQVLAALMFTKSISYTDDHQCSSVNCTNVHRLVVGAQLRIHTGELDPPKCPKCHSARFSFFLLRKDFSTIWTMSSTLTTSSISLFQLAKLARCTFFIFFCMNLGGYILCK